MSTALNFLCRGCWKCRRKQLWVWSQQTYHQEWWGHAAAWCSNYVPATLRPWLDLVITFPPSYLKGHRVLQDCPNSLCLSIPLTVVWELCPAWFRSIIKAVPHSAGMSTSCDLSDLSFQLLTDLWTSSAWASQKTPLHSVATIIYTPCNASKVWIQPTVFPSLCCLQNAPCALWRPLGFPSMAMLLSVSRVNILFYYKLHLFTIISARASWDLA